eukprot:2953949-Rhodomonas_salina.1
MRADSECSGESPASSQLREAQERVQRCRRAVHAERRGERAQGEAGSGQSLGRRQDTTRGFDKE